MSAFDLIIQFSKDISSQIRHLHEIRRVELVDQTLVTGSLLKIWTGPHDEALTSPIPTHFRHNLELSIMHPI